MTTRRLPFCTILPLFSVCVWILFVAVPVTFGYLHLIYLSHGSSSVLLHTRNFSITVPANNFFRFTVNTVGALRGSEITALSLPGFVVELLVSVRTWPRTWQPAGFTLWGWRSVSFPLFALPAWYYAGNGIDGLLGRIDLRVRDAVLGSLLAGGCTILGGGLTIALPAADRDASLKWISAGFLFWAMLFGTVAVAAVRQGRPKAAIFVQVLSGLVFGVVILWAWTNSWIPLWEVSNADGSYSIGWRSGVITLCIAIGTQLLSWAIFRKPPKRIIAQDSGENPA
jgi:hypothetical protein